MKRLLITIPCYNEEIILENNVKIISEYAQGSLANYNWKILIIDNASTDNTYKIAQFLSQADQSIMVTRCPERGRGVALRTTWQRYHDFDIYSYLDIDLATDLKDFKRLVTKIDDGYDISVGSRYLVNSDTERSYRRESMSRIYNLLLKTFFKVRFRDAQCGFKACNTKVIANILPLTKDNGWFWDTELMLLGERKNYKIIEIPVSWREIRDELRISKVSPIIEAFRQLHNIYLMKKRLKRFIDL